jgi:hypothetical protein
LKEFRDIYLSWRKGPTFSRHIVGVLKKNATSGVRFYYFEDKVKLAEAEGFSAYTEFPQFEKEYFDNVLEIFSQRLIKLERSDIQRFYDFWEIPKKYAEDNFYLLAHTMGLLPTDNFEFLADYYPIKNLCFITEIAGLSSRKIPSNSLKNEDVLTWKKDPNNKHDKFAVKLYKGDLELGYIKKVHSHVFYKTDTLKITVKAIDENGVLKRVFIKVRHSKL